MPMRTSAVPSLTSRWRSPGHLFVTNLGLRVGRATRMSKRPTRSAVVGAGKPLRTLPLDGSGSQMLEELEDCGIDLRAAVLLSPMAAIFQHHGPAQLRNEGLQIRDQLAHAAEGNNKITVAGDKERGDGHTRASERTQEFPIAIDVAIPIEATAKPRACEFTRIEG